MSCSLNKTRNLAKKNKITKYNDDLFENNSNGVNRFYKFVQYIKKLAISKWGDEAKSLPDPMKLNGKKVEYSLQFFNGVDALNKKYGGASKPSFKKGLEDETSVTKDVITKILDKLKSKLGVDYVFVTSAEAKAIVKDPKYNGIDPFYHTDGKVYIPEGSLTLESAIHEFSHPFVDAIQKHNPKLFAKTVIDILSSKQGEEIEALVLDLYKNDISVVKDGELTNKGLKEVAVRAITEKARGNINPETGKVFLSAIKRLFIQMKQAFRDIFGNNIDISKLDEKTSLQELADMLTIGEGKINLNKKYSEYKYVSGMPFQDSTIKKMKDGDQTITIRQFDHETGIYTIDGEEYHIENLGLRKISDFKDAVSLKNDFKGKDYMEGKWLHIDKFFQGKKELYVYQITKINDSIKNKQVSFKKSLELKEKNNSNKNSDEVTKVIKNLKEILTKQKALFKKKPNSKKFIDDIEKIEKDLEENKNEIGALLIFVEDSNNYINSLYKRFQSLKDSLDEKEELTSKERNDALNLINKIRELSSSYNILLDIKQLMYGDNSSPIDNDFKLLTEANDRRERLIRDYEEVGIDLITDWLYQEAKSINEKLTKNNKTKFLLTKELIKSELTLASGDINIFEKMFEGAISSKDPISALLAKSIKFKMHEASLEDYEALEILVKSFEENDIQDHKKYIHEIEIQDRVKNEAGEVSYIPKMVKAMITKFRGDLFDKNKSEFFAKLGEKPVDEEGLKDYNKKAAIWFKENTKVKSRAKNIIEQRREELSPEDFNAWFSENTKEVENTFYDNGLYKIDLIKESNPESIAMWTRDKIFLYSGELISPSDKYINNEYKKLETDKYYMTLLNQYNKANDQLPVKYRLRNGILPQQEKESRDKSVGEVFSKENLKNSLSVTAHDIKYKVQTLSGEEYHSVPIYYTYILDQSLVSENLIESVLKFTQMSNNYKHMTEIKSNVDILSSLISKRDVIETSGAGEKVKDAVLGTFRKKGKLDAKKVNERLQNFIDMAFYGNKEIKESWFGGKVDPNKVAGKLQFLTALSGMALNATSGITNSLWGNFQTLAQSIGGVNYTKSEWLSAQAHYIANLTSYAGDVGKVRNKSKDSQLMDIFDAIQGEFRGNFGEKIGGSRARRLITTNSLFFINNGTEHQIQMTSMIAMMKHRKVKNAAGVEISLYDAYEMVDGRIKLKSGIVFSEREKFDFMGEIHSINKKLHGVYNEFDKGELQRHWYGKLALMFRKHIYKGMVNRYGKEQLDVESGDVEEGYYRTFLSKLYQDFKEFGLIGMIQYKSYSPEQKTAFLKTMLDVSVLMTLMLLSAAVHGFDDDDEKIKKTNWLQDQFILQSRRFQADISFYYILNKDALRVISNPTVTSNTVSNIWDFVSQLSNPTERYQRKSGIFDKGDLKLKAKAFKAIPIIRSVVNFMTPGDQLKIYNK